MGTKRGRLIEGDDSEEERIEMGKKRGRFVMEEDDDDSAAFLPPEIITHEILSRLPADSAVGCKGICKPWLSLMDHPSFIDTHTRQLISSSTSNPKKFGNYLIPTSSSSSSGYFLCAQQEYREFHLQFVEYSDYNVDVGEKLVPELKPSKPITHHPFPFYDNWGILIISSCNGLVFMGSNKPNYYNDMFVCNPFTREYVNLRTVDTAATTNDNKDQRDVESKGGMAYGFGYLPSTNEYKVVSLYYDDLEEVGNAYTHLEVVDGETKEKFLIGCIVNFIQVSLLMELFIGLQIKQIRRRFFHLIWRTRSSEWFSHYHHEHHHLTMLMNLGCWEDVYV